MANSPLLQSPVTPTVTDDDSPDLEGFDQDLMRLAANSGSAGRMTIVDSAPMARMSTPVDFEPAFARYTGKPMATYA